MWWNFIGRSHEEGPGQWFNYTVNVASAVTGALHIANVAGTNLSGAVNIPATGGWNTHFMSFASSG